MNAFDPKRSAPDVTLRDRGNLAEILNRSSVRFPDKPALIESNRSVTYSELDAAVDRFAANVAVKVPGTGERIGILLPNSIEFAVAFFGIVRAGHVVLALSTAYTARELGHQVTDSGAVLVITDEAHRDRLSNVETVIATGDWDGLQADPPKLDHIDPPVGGESLALLLYTSGTTGRPKGAMLSHRALLANLEQLSSIEHDIVSETDISLLVLPLFHVYGLNTGLCLDIAAGATAVLARDFDPVATLRLIREAGITSMIGAPPMYVAWAMLPDLRESLKSLRLAVSGAAPLPPSVQADVFAASGQQVFQGYGLTETAPVLATSLCSPTPKPGSIGRPIPGVELQLLDESGDVVEDGDPGEIAVRGENLFSGYWPDGAGGPDEGGWFRTGDVAYADEEGDLFLIDRTRELILVSGFNVYPREVEDVLASHVGVKEVAVIGVPHPYTGETVKALIVAADDVTLDVAELIEFAATRLARFKCPTTVELVPSLPHSLIGKVAKGRLRSNGS